MNLLQYAFSLSGDFDMDAIRTRIAAKRHLLDQLPGLCWKAWLMSEPKAHLRQPKTYAPLYLFDATPPLVSFMTGPLYKGVTDSFGWTIPFQGPWIAPKPIQILDAKSCSLHNTLVLSRDDLATAVKMAAGNDPYEIARVQMWEISRMCIRTYRFWSVAAEQVSSRNAEIIYDVVAVSAPAKAGP